MTKRTIANGIVNAVRGGCLIGVIAVLVVALYQRPLLGVVFAGFLVFCVVFVWALRHADNI